MTLEAEGVNNPEALGKVFREMSGAKKVPMTEEQTKYSIHIMMAKDEGIEKMYDSFAGAFPINAFLKRCEIVFPIKYEKRLALWLALMTHEFNIGGMLLVGYYVQWWAFTNNETGVLSLDAVTERCFPWGIFDKETVHEFWDKQKVKAQPDNLIDHASAALSFIPQSVNV